MHLTSLIHLSFCLIWRENSTRTCALHSVMNVSFLIQNFLKESLPHNPSPPPGNLLSQSECRKSESKFTDKTSVPGPQSPVPRSPPPQTTGVVWYGCLARRQENCNNFRKRRSTISHAFSQVQGRIFIRLARNWFGHGRGNGTMAGDGGQGKWGAKRLAIRLLSPVYTADTIWVDLTDVQMHSMVGWSDGRWTEPDGPAWVTSLISTKTDKQLFVAAAVGCCCYLGCRLSGLWDTHFSEITLTEMQIPEGQRLWQRQSERPTEPAKTKNSKWVIREMY